MSKNGNEMQNNKPANKRRFGRTTWIPLQAGCLTMGLAGIAILVGLLLDTQLGTTPQWTLILLIASAPFALVGVFLLTRRTLRKMREEIKASETNADD